MIKTILLFVAVACFQNLAIAQDHTNEIQKDLRPFSRVIVSPKINLILTEGDQESIRVVYHRVDPAKINIEVKGKTLQVYLDDSKFTEKMVRVSRYQKRGYYSDASVTAYVTYRKINHLEIRGDQELTCHSPIVAEKFTLKAYGKNEINLRSVKTAFFKTQLYGENNLRVRGGKAEYQKYKLYGENQIDTEDMRGYYALATIFGESKLRIFLQDEIKINAFGESQVSYTGNANINRGLIFGRTEIRKLN
jgi:hypothetical protein